MFSKIFRSEPPPPPDERVEALWARVKTVLSDPTYDLFSYSGIAEELEVPAESVKTAVHAHFDEVTLSLMYTKDKETLFALASRPRSWRVNVSSIYALMSGDFILPR